MCHMENSAKCRLAQRDLECGRELQIPRWRYTIRGFTRIRVCELVAAGRRMISRQRRNVCVYAFSLGPSPLCWTERVTVIEQSSHQGLDDVVLQ